MTLRGRRWLDEDQREGSEEGPGQPRGASCCADGARGGALFCESSDRGTVLASERAQKTLDP